MIAPTGGTSAEPTDPDRDGSRGSIRALLVIDSLGAGGAERSTAALVPHLRNLGVDVTLVTLYRAHEGSERSLRSEGQRVLVLESRRFIGRLRELRSIVSSTQPDVIHTSLFQSDVLGRLASVRSRAAVVSTITSVPRRHRPRTASTPPSWKVRAVDVGDSATAWAFNDLLLAVTPGVAELTASYHPRLASKLVVAERGRSRAELGPPSAHRRDVVRSSLGVTQETTLLVTVGRQEPAKGHVDLLAALRHLLERSREVHLVIAGKVGAASPEIQRKLESDPLLATAVTTLGHHDDIGGLLSAADIFVLSSHHEGAAGSVLESMAMGTPIVATEIEGLKGILADGANCSTVPVSDPQAMATAIARLIDQPTIAEAQAKRAREVFEARFTIERSAARTVEVYRSAIAHRRQSL